MIRPRIFLLLSTAASALASGAAAIGQLPPMRGPSEAELATVEDDQDVFPRAFRGKWAGDLATCDDLDGKGFERITSKRITGYETDAMLLKAAMQFEVGPNKREAYTVTALVAESGEGELGIARYRISLSAGRLYLSSAGAKPSEHWNYPLIRCPSDRQ